MTQKTSIPSTETTIQRRGFVQAAMIGVPSLLASFYSINSASAQSLSQTDMSRLYGDVQASIEGLDAAELNALKEQVKIFQAGLSQGGDPLVLGVRLIDSNESLRSIVEENTGAGFLVFPGLLIFLLVLIIVVLVITIEEEG